MQISGVRPADGHEVDIRRYSKEETTSKLRCKVTITDRGNSNETQSFRMLLRGNWEGISEGHIGEFI
jgi:hypothetical protein